MRVLYRVLKIFRELQLYYNKCIILGIILPLSLNLNYSHPSYDLQNYKSYKYIQKSILSKETFYYTTMKFIIIIKKTNK